MSFSKQPVNSTYQTKTVSLIKEFGSRDATVLKDNYFLNAYVEMQKNKDTQERDMFLVKRAGCSEGIASTDSGGVRGAYYWKDQNKVFLAILNKIYVYNATTLVLITTLAAVFGTTSGDVGFEEFLYSDTTTKLVVSDGTTLATIDTSNVVANAVGVPVHNPNIVFLDGELYVLKTNSSSIYNSDDDNPLAWTGGDFIDAEMRADQVSRIALLNNYLIALGTKSLEYFYDGANPSGSPLSRNDSPMKAVGYVGGFAKLGNKIYFIGETVESLPDVYVLEDFKITPLGNEAIRRHFEANRPVCATIVSFNGHDFYVVTTAVSTFALDLDTKLWGLWGYQSTTTFPINFSLPTNYGSGYRNLFTTTADQSVNIFSTALGQDKNINYSWKAVTENEFFDSYNRKSCNRLTIYADKPVSSLPVLVQTSDDDYQTWSTGQTIELFQELPCGYRWGQFRRRAHMLSYTGALPLRIVKLELDLNLGNS